MESRYTALPIVVPGAPTAAAAAAPAFRLRRRDEMALRMRLPEAAVGREVLEERSDALQAFTNRVAAQRHRLVALLVDRLLQVDATRGKLISVTAGVVHAIILANALDEVRSQGCEGGALKQEHADRGQGQERGVWHRLFARYHAAEE